MWGLCVYFLKAFKVKVYKWKNAPDFPISHYSLKALWDGQGKIKIYFVMSRIKMQLSGKRSIPLLLHSRIIVGANFGGEYLRRFNYLPNIFFLADLKNSEDIFFCFDSNCWKMSKQKMTAVRILLPFLWN